MEGLDALIWEAGPHDQIAMGKSSVMKNGGLGAVCRLGSGVKQTSVAHVLSTRSRSKSYTFSPRRADFCAGAA